MCVFSIGPSHQIVPPDLIASPYLHAMFRDVDVKRALMAGRPVTVKHCSVDLDNPEIIEYDFGIWPICVWYRPNLNPIWVRVKCSDCCMYLRPNHVLRHLLTRRHQRITVHENPLV